MSNCLFVCFLSGCEAAVPSILRYFQSKHIARRSLVAQLCGAWTVVSSAAPQATAPQVVTTRTIHTSQAALQHRPMLDSAKESQ
eukprot:1840627-Amphidinium_carterae.1